MVGDHPHDAHIVHDKPNKGHEGGACNRQRCQTEPAPWYNHGSHSWYCGDCRESLEFDSFNLREWNTNWLPRLGYPQFETAQMIKDRKS